jgi:hypothetical protein
MKGEDFHGLCSLQARKKSAKLLELILYLSFVDVVIAMLRHGTNFGKNWTICR